MMIEIGIVPTKKGYAAVGLRKTLGKSEKLIIRAPFPVTKDLETRILGRLYREVADYLWDVGKWEGIGFVALLWAVASISVIATNRLLDYGLKMILLYFWVRLWFTSDGLLLFLPYLMKVTHRARASRIRKAKENLVVEVELMDWPTLSFVRPDPDEEDCIRDMMDRFPQSLGPYYIQMLKVDPPWLMDQYPFTFLARARNWIMGSPIRLPRAVYYIGRDL